MPDLTVSADIDLFMQAANDAAARTELGLTALATTTPGTGVATALAINIGSAGAPILFNGAAGTPSSLVGTNITGTAAGLTAGVASAVAVGGITGLGTNVATALALNVGSAGAFITFNGNAGTPSALVGTNITGTAAGLTAGTASAVAVGGITGLGANVATFLATPSSANLRSAVTDESGTGALLFAGNVNIENIGFTADGGGSALSTGKVKGYFTCPYAGTITAWSIMVDTGTATIEVWKVASGTAVPTAANSINTAGVAISSGTAVRSATVTDFTTTAVAANDIFAFEITAVAGATEMSFGLQINKT